MFCIKCGASLEDGAKFCPQCGASQVAPAPAASAAGTPAQPHRSSTDRPQQPVYQQPQQQPVYQQPPQPAYQQQPVYQQPVYQQPYQPPAPPPKKKKHGGLIAVLVILVVIAAAGFLLRNKISSFVLSSVAPAEKYYVHVEKESIANFSANAADAYDTLLLSNANIDNKTSEGGVELRLGSGGRDLLMDLAGSTLKQLNPDEDLAWFQTLGIQSSVVTQGDKKSLQMQLTLNGVGLVTLNLVADTAADKAYISIPELKKEYVEMPLSQLSSMSGSGPMQIVGLIGGLAQADDQQLADALKALPDKSKMESLLKKYLDMVLEAAEQVEKEKVTLTVEGVSVEVTALEVTADGEALAKAMESIFTEMKKDKDIKDIVVNLSEAQGEDGTKAYEDFLKELDEALDDLDSVKENSSGFKMTVYTDAGGEVIGREFTTENFAFILKKPEKGGKFGLDLQIGSEGSAFSLKGKGTKSGDKLTGELDMEVGGTLLGVLALDGFDEEKFKSGMLSGAIEIRPSDALMSSMSSSASLSSILSSLVLRLEMDTGKDKGSMSLIILNDSSELLTLSAKVNAKAGGKISSVSGEDMEKWSSEMDTQAFLSTLVNSLKKAKVPEAYTSMIPTGES